MEETPDTPALEIKQFAKKVDPVSAVQFTGGEVNGKAIQNWVRENDRGALWYKPEEAWTSSDGKNGYPAIEEYISLRTPRGLKDVKVGDWVYQDSEGDFRSLKSGDFENQYAAV